MAVKQGSVILGEEDGFYCVFYEDQGMSEPELICKISVNVVQGYGQFNDFVGFILNQVTKNHELTIEYGDPFVIDDSNIN